jgi:hypothetical protein
LKKAAANANYAGKRLDDARHQLLEADVRCDVTT